MNRNKSMPGFFEVAGVLVVDLDIRKIRISSSRALRGIHQYQDPVEPLTVNS